ncbi:MAG: glycosyltransferase, partial [Phycisphaerales bacterium]|nr:glycosyltransferase [Phycisphaerales bacterium]
EIASRREIPAMIVNGRATDEKSVRRFEWPIVRGVARRMFSQVSWVGAQDEVHAERFRRLGVAADRVVVTGSVKYDSADIADTIEGQEALRDAMGIDASRPLWVCGSTGPGEEAVILDAYARLIRDFPELQIAIVPRKPERFDEVARLIVSRGYACLRRSTGAPQLPENAVEPRPAWLGDTVGELRAFYSLAAIVFVGRSLVPMGGSDLMEAAGLAKAILSGPHTENFAEVAALLTAANAIVVVRDASELAAGVAKLLGDAAERARMSRAARATILERRGATEKTVQRMLEFLF